jgi:hypothetical protein
MHESFLHLVFRDGANDVVRDVVGLTSRIVLAIPRDEIEVQRNISRPDLLARVC